MLNKNSEQKAHDQEKQKPEQQEGRFHKAFTIVGIVMCVILIPMLIINCTLIIKSFANKDEVPDFGGVMPLIVLTDSMAPDIKSGDLIFCKTVEAEDVKEGDVISFFDPAGNGTSIVTHKVVAVIVGDDGKLSFKTWGINNNTEDKLPVPGDKVVGKYNGVRIAGAGSFALFMQSTPGFIVCVIVPIVLIVGYDLLRRRKYEKRKGDDMASLMAELEALRAQQQKAEPIENTDEPQEAEPSENTDSADPQ